MTDLERAALIYLLEARQRELVEQSIYDHTLQNLLHELRGSADVRDARETLHALSGGSFINTHPK